MSSWRDKILKEFEPHICRLTLVADPDELLLEEQILAELRQRGFELISFDDHVYFRYLYESRFRAHWDKGEQTNLVVLLRSLSNDLTVLPYDLLQSGRKLTFSLADLFPTLSYPVIATLDRADLDALYEAQAKYATTVLGSDATKQFILRYVFDIEPELIKQPADLLRILLRRHYRGQKIPTEIDEWFIRRLRQSGLFDEWPLEMIIPDRDAFLAFLQERWPTFLESLAQKDKKMVKDAVYQDLTLTIPGPALLPFDHDDVRIYIDNLFLDGLLQPVEFDRLERIPQSWVGIGVLANSADNNARRIERLIELIQETLPDNKARHQEWQIFSYRWAEFLALMMNTEIGLQEKHQEILEDLKHRLDAIFKDWLLNRYAGLVNLPPTPPLMLHHLPRFMARKIVENKHAKIAFLLVDGLSLEQWIAMRDILKAQDEKLRFREAAVFAWIPTITSVSRQAAFAGKPPIYFPSSLYTTEKEETLWIQFWIDEGVQANEVRYVKGLGDLSSDQDNGKMAHIIELLKEPKIRIIGLIIDKIDKIMHGIELGTAGMHNQIKQWCKKGFMLNLINLLFDGGFDIYLSSDHGNIEAKGLGSPREGAIAELRGERVRIYSDPVLIKRVKAKFVNSIEWPPIGLPEKYYALIADGRYAFTQQNNSIVCHGGISMEEVIVPFVKITRENSKNARHENRV